MWPSTRCVAPRRRDERDRNEPILREARWCRIKRLENLIENQEIKLKEMPDNSTTSRASGLTCCRSCFTVLGRRESGAGREDPRCLVHQGDAEQARADEEGRQEPRRHRHLSDNVVRAKRSHFGGRCRGFERRGKPDRQKSVRFSDGKVHQNRFVSGPRTITGARSSPTDSAEEVFFWE